MFLSIFKKKLKSLCAEITLNSTYETKYWKRQQDVLENK